MAFIYFGNFLKRLFSFFVGFEPEMSIKEIKMLFGLFFFFFFKLYLPTHLSISHLHSLSGMCTSGHIH